MKKNIRYRNNNNNNNNYNQIYSLNYKFDSSSIAGKYSGTALDLIKRYNELAKESHGNGDYVNAEVFRQYAEHYRKIVTEINERKNLARPFHENNRDENQGQNNEKAAVSDIQGSNKERAAAPVSDIPENTQPQEKSVAPAQVLTQDEKKNEGETLAKSPVKKEFKVIEISSVNSKAVAEVSAEDKKITKPRGRRKVSETAASV